MKKGPRLRGTEEFPIDYGYARLTQDGPLLTLFLNDVESSCIDINDPTHMDFEYMQHMTCALQATYETQARIQVLHLGGAACALPRAWVTLFPHSRHTAVEYDAALAQLVREHFDLPRAPQLKIRVGEARHETEKTRPQRWDVIVRDTFAHGEIPSHLRTIEYVHSVARALRPGGLYMVNCAHGGTSDARYDIAAVSEVFDRVIAIADPKVGRGGRRGNVVLIAQNTSPKTHVSAQKTSFPHNDLSYETASAPVPVVRTPTDSPFTKSESESESASSFQPIVYHNTDFSLCDFEELERLLRRLPLPARVIQGHDMRKWYAGIHPLHDEGA
ncbi:spermidine synthase [Schaalia sp. lx-100]|uniref:spermidine synthase n=1 Tax=Schaalia sp. lx-100 TaxID=2899081 RepID=UPI001E2CE5D6|nr:fused MFS/spermidine synthase [Schaalia sp. lx-100]MCD4557041.1 fused MFS/spermidine synthase [Schaalia sp. lx-100]